MPSPLPAGRVTGPKSRPLARAPEALLATLLLGGALGRQGSPLVLASQLHLERPLHLGQDLLVGHGLALLVLGHHLRQGWWKLLGNLSYI